METRTQQTIETLRGCQAVESHRAWTPSSGGSARYYLQLRGYSPRYHGDRSMQVYVIDDRLVIARGRGRTTEALDSSIETLRAYAAEHGIAVEGR